MSIMPLVNPVVTLIIVGVALWLINNYIPACNRNTSPVRTSGVEGSKLSTPDAFNQDSKNLTTRKES